MIGKISTKKYFSKIVTILVVTSFFNTIIPLSYAQTMNDQEVGEMRIRIVRCFNEPQISNATPVPTIPRLDSLMSDCIGFNVMDFLSRSQTLHNFYRAARDAYYRGRGGNGGRDNGGDDTTPPGGGGTGGGATVGLAGGECSLVSKINYAVQDAAGFDIGDDLILPAVIQTNSVSLSTTDSTGNENFTGFGGGSSGGGGASRSWDDDASGSENTTASTGYISPRGIPVNEVGPLLLISSNSRELLQQICKFSKSIDTTTKAIKVDTGAIRIDVAEIARIQKRFEEKTFVTDPAIRKLARENLKKTEEESWKSILSGRTTNNLVKEDTYVPTPKDYILEERWREAALFLKELDDISKMDNASANTKDAATKLKSMIEIAVKTGLGSGESRLLGLIEQPDDPSFNDPWLEFHYKTSTTNNVYGLFDLVYNELKARLDRAEKNAREELLAGGGFVPESLCLEKVTTPLGNVCRNKATITPAQIIRDTISILHTAEIQQAITAGGFGDKEDAEAVSKTTEKTFKSKRGEDIATFDNTTE